MWENKSGFWVSARAVGIRSGRYSGTWGARLVRRRVFEELGSSFGFCFLARGSEGPSSWALVGVKMGQGWGCRGSCKVCLGGSGQGLLALG